MTMDVERIEDLSPTGGPPTWEFAERSVRSYCGLLAEYGLPTTLFVVPDTATAQAKMLREMAQETGAELGMHFHAQSWRDHYRTPEAYDYLGGYTAEEQHRFLSGARDQVAESLGEHPRAFRPGNFSANDATFGVLADLGFTHGSVSQPGRSVPRAKAVWAGVSRPARPGSRSAKTVWRDAHLDVHRAHRAFRMVPGDLDFIEVPLTSDQERTDHWTGVGDVRFEQSTSEQVAKAVRQHVARQVAEKTPFKHVCLFGHNTGNFWSADRSEEGYRGELEGAVIKIREIADEFGLEVKGATLRDVREAFLEMEGDSLRRT
jgi:hypothetical protein